MCKRKWFPTFFNTGLGTPNRSHSRSRTGRSCSNCSSLRSERERKVSLFPCHNDTKSREANSFHSVETQEATRSQTTHLVHWVQKQQAAQSLGQHGNINITQTQSNAGCESKANIFIRWIHDTKRCLGAHISFWHRRHLGEKERLTINKKEIRGCEKKVHCICICSG